MSGHSVPSTAPSADPDLHQVMHQALLLMNTEHDPAHLLSVMDLLASCYDSISEHEGVDSWLDYIEAYFGQLQAVAESMAQYALAGPALSPGHPNNKRVFLDGQFIHFLFVEENLTAKEIALRCGLSESTIWRRLGDLGIRKGDTRATDDEVVAMLAALKGSFPTMRDHGAYIMQGTARFFEAV